MSLTLCAGSADWIAYQNEGGRWTHLGGAGSWTFKATPRLGVARFVAHPNGTGSSLHVAYLTAAQAARLFTCPAFPIPPDGMISGSIAGASDHFYAQVYLNGMTAYMSQDRSEWTVSAQPVPATLVAVRYDSMGNAMFADRLVVRRDQSYLPGTFVPLIDFASEESFAPQVNTASFAGARASLTVWYISNERVHLLSSVPPIDATPQSAPLHSLPAVRLAEGDIHMAHLRMGELRSVDRYFRVGEDVTLSVGPELATPTLTTVATQPYRRIRVELPSQPQYDASVDVYLAQNAPASNSSSDITLYTTREYFGGTPSVWALEVPDLSSIPGFQLVHAFAEGEFTWYVRATNARFDLNHRTAQDGETALHALRLGRTP